AKTSHWHAHGRPRRRRQGWLRENLEQPANPLNSERPGCRFLPHTLPTTIPFRGRHGHETPTPAKLVRGRGRCCGLDRPQRLSNPTARHFDDLALAGLPEALSAVHPEDAAVPAAPGTGAHGTGDPGAAAGRAAVHPATAGCTAT